MDTTSFSVSGADEPESAPESPTAADEVDAAEGDLDARVVAVTDGYSRDRRADLKQWMLALATTREGDVPLFLRPLDGNSSDRVSLLAAAEALADQLHSALDADASSERPLFVAASGLCSEATMERLNAAGIAWVSRVPATLNAAQMALARRDAAWQTSADGQIRWGARAGAGSGTRAVGRGAHSLRRAAGTSHAGAAGEQCRRRVAQALVAPEQPSVCL